MAIRIRCVLPEQLFTKRRKMRSIVCAALALSAMVQSDSSAEVGDATASRDQQPRQGITHVVRMTGNATAYRFEPDSLNVQQGDSVQFLMVSGGPHNVAFNPGTLSDEAKAAFTKAMPEQVATVSGKFLMRAGETYTVSFGEIPVGVYRFFCTPHLAMEQLGVIVVTPP